ncbi:phytoene desaturase family protein [Thermogemmatispora sp.]|uniref:phytoene desaturase family protein n=1 Tax=Thermogemmatispora sp. TaxID=1968838 RepID=UPI001E00C6DC|nr:phytoene desaturase family protein [Thermogemmatispora sp.]MBX5449014.1 phytoene desaturase [Thermogemmatispora sp.]
MSSSSIARSFNSLPAERSGARPRVIVIGAGFGGLATAIRLQAAGAQVTLIEARDRPGGRAYQLTADGFTFDMGPSLLTAPWLLQDLWQAAGRRLEDDLTLVALRPFYRIHFVDGSYFDYWGRPAEDEAEIARFEPRDVTGYRAFLTATARIYQRAFAELAGEPFLRLGDFLRVTPELVRLGAQRSVYRFVSHYFRHPQLRMVFSFHPLFIGGNPFRASAIYSIVPYLERLGGVHFVPGGMYTLVEAMTRLFTSLGGELRCGQPVERILVRAGRIWGVLLADGALLQAEAVVANSDVTTTYLRLLPAEVRPRGLVRRLERARYSMSCFLLYLGLNRQYPQLRHHTIFMPRDYRGLIRALFDGQGLPQDLALYLHTPTRTDASLAPPGGESLYVLAPVPHLGHGIDWQREAPRLRERILSYLEEQAGLTGLRASIVYEQRFTPLDFAGELRSHLGAAFSLEPTLFQSAYFRPHNRAPDLEGLYFVGAGTHPGAGIPGVLLSASITARLVRQDLALQASNERS